MGKDFNDKFRDCIDKINNIAKSKGWRNGKAWAAFAVKFDLISTSMKIEYDRCHDLRNTMSHGNAKSIIVHQDTYSTAREFLRIIEAKIRENRKIQKFNNTINDKKRDKRSIVRSSKHPVLSDMEIAYLSDILNRILKHYAIHYLIVDICMTLFSCMNHPRHEVQGLVIVLKTMLFLRFYEHNDDRAKKYCDLLSSFL